jgi:hypothetical protein
MLARLRSRLTYANVIATLALFLALGGSGYAALTLPPGSVHGRQIARDAVSSPKVRNHSLRGVDFARGQLPKGDKGDKGDTGAPGQTGATGSPGASIIGGVVSSGYSDAGNGVSLFQPFENHVAGDPDHLAYVAPQTFVARDLYIRIDNPPGAGASRTFRLAVDNNPTTLGCTLGPGDTHCEDGSTQVTVQKGSTYILRMDNSASPPNFGDSIHWAFRATLP